MKNHFFQLFQYNDWANEQIFSSLKLIDNIPEKGLLILSHIIAAQDIWYERIAGKHDWNIEVWDVYTLQECTLLSNQSTQQWLNLIRKLKAKDFDKLIKYKNSKGSAFESTMREILAHVINHSIYHRGQINLLLRQNGIEPASTDFIFYSRL